MEVAYAILVEESTHTGEARRVAMQLAARLGFDETAAGNVGLVVTEAAKNLLKHAGGGEIVIRALDSNGTGGVEMLAIDKGRGIGNVARCFQDGYSTAGTPGTGLGAISRLSTLYDLYSQPGAGTALLAHVWTRRPAAAPDAGSGFCAGGVSVAMRGETVCGDAWGFRKIQPGRGRLILADGLGHGLLAADASQAALAAADRHAEEEPVAVMQRIHQALRPTRGAAVAVADVDRDAGVVRFTGIGNISGSIISPEGAVQHMVSQAGTAGHEVHKITEFQYRWAAGSLLVMHSDGLGSHWSLAKYPGLALRHPSIIAAVLYRDFARGRDDVTVAAVRESEAE